MGDARVTQIGAQVLVFSVPPLRVTQVGANVLVHRCQADLGIIAPMLSHLTDTCLTLCTLWKVTAEDGSVVRYCDHTRNITYQTELYKAAPIQPTAYQSSSDLSADNQEIASPISADGFTEIDLLGGKWDYAQVEITVINYLDTSMGHAKRVTGRIGEVQAKNQRFTVEFRGITQLLNQEIGDLTSPTCRAELGDAACGVALGPFTHATSVVAVLQSQAIFTVGTVQADGYFRHGKATFTSGANAGLSTEIKDNVGTKIILMLPMRSTIATSDGVTLITGCDHTRNTCRVKFNNALRMRAEPDLPGRDRVLKFPRKPTPDIPDTE